MAFRIHALNVAHIVALLPDGSGSARGTCTGEAAGQRACSCADCGSAPATERCACGCTESRANGSAP